MVKEQLTWIPIIPLIGGFALGAEKALGKPPEFVSSLDGFWKNDSQYMNYQNNTLGRNIEYRVLNPTDRTFKEKINIVVGTPPCAALSQLNTGSNDSVKGAGCAKNDFMYIVAEQGIKCYDADVVIIENAPALYTNKGKAVANRIQEIAHENGYSISFYKTSTHYHGIPQARDRCFVFLWKLKSAPILNWFKRPYKKFEDYLSEIDTNSVQQDIIINPNIQNEPFYMFMQHWLSKDDVRDDISFNHKTSFQWVIKNNLLNQSIDYFEKINHEKGLILANRAKDKFAEGKGVWDGSVHVAKEHTQAWISRNMNDTIHPKENRSCTIRESLYIMGFPNDFELVGGRKNFNLIAQNVPVCTASDMVNEAIEALLGNRQFSNLNLFKQNNHKEVYTTPLVENINTLNI